MLIFGHVGVTLGIAAAVHRICLSRGKKYCGGVVRLALADCPVPEEAITECKKPFGARSSSPDLKNGLPHIDYRLVAVGSLLPDIIDKPVGLFFFQSTFGNGRLFSHGLLFLLVMSIIGIVLYRTRGTLSGLVLAGGTLLHLLLDEIWRSPLTLLWPVLGWQYPKDYPRGVDWFSYLPKSLATPKVGIFEVAGALIAFVLIFKVFRNKAVRRFIRRGSLL